MHDADAHPFADLDRAAVGRSLSQIADRPGDFADAWFERLEEVELPPEGAQSNGPGLNVRREEGLAVRLVRDADVWHAARDAIGPQELADALRHTARALPAAHYPAPGFVPPPWPRPAAAPEVLELPVAVQRAIRRRRAAFPLALTVRRHRRWIQVVGSGKLVAEPQSESFYSAVADTPFGRAGALFPDLGDGDAVAERFADLLVERFRARDAAPPGRCCGAVVLAPAAAAVLLHEAVAHALEADLLALGGDPEAAAGLRLGGAVLDVLDDPSSAPEPVRRSSDDEGQPVRRRWLLRQGVVAEPLADRRWAAAAETFAAGAARRAGRHFLPSPRSSHLELLAGEASEEELVAAADGGLLLAAADSGRLDPLTGGFELRFPCAQRISGGAAGAPVGPCRLAGRVADLLAAVAAVGSRALPAGAGWCAKGGQRMAVWATAPAILLEGVEVTPDGANGWAGG